MLYRFLYERLMSRVDAEVAHERAMKAISLFGKSPFASFVSHTIGYRGGKQIHGLLERPLPGRVGLAAGQDKKCEAVEGLDALGFAFVEVGTVTPLPQPGNDKPRLWRHNDITAFRNRMGFNNDGADVVASRLDSLRRTPRGARAIIGVNIGKNKWVSAQKAPEDYYICALKLARYADYLVVNVSSPNTPGLRDLQSVESLREIVHHARRGASESTKRRVPILVKIAPDLADDDIVAITRMVREEDIDGVVATNTTINHSFGEGGISGRPVFERAREVVSLVRRELGMDYLIIGVGGIFSADDAREMVRAGADLVQVLSSFIFEGPLLPGRLNRALANS
ncbi:MAG: quinone-dependent dihydroorotate dehydrogenase [Actinomycetaceae bacterium]|nr:quinone-dependent dihydroorotate dehydrogenase [Actinomycetaceae bacterium]